MAYASNLQPTNGGFDIGGSGIQSPGYVPIGGPATSRLTQLGLNPGASPWALLATQAQSAAAEKARESGAQQVAGATAGTDANLAANGGLSSGARERASEGGQKDYLAMVQDTGNQENLNNLQIGENDAQNKMQQLSGAANVEGQNAQAMNSYNSSMYQAQMQAWAAQQQANATANAGKK